MYYRRNSDERIRELERRFSSDPHVLPQLNHARIGAGLPPITMIPPLEWGYHRGLPPTATTAWGARAIFRDGSVDIVYGSWSFLYENDRKQLQEILDGNPAGTGALREMRSEAHRLYNAGILRGDIDQEAILYEDDEAVIIANTNASHGYLYITAFLKPFDWVSSMPTCDRCGAERAKNLLAECLGCHQRVCVGCFEPCAGRCPDCNEVRCYVHTNNAYAAKCEECGVKICPGCEKTRPAKDCPDCGRLYCHECREMIASCPCQEEEWCEQCGEQREKCESCGETRCLCEPCSCDACEECGEQQTECEDCGDEACACSGCSCDED